MADVQACRGAGGDRGALSMKQGETERQGTEGTVWVREGGGLAVDLAAMTRR